MKNIYYCARVYGRDLRTMKCYPGRTTKNERFFYQGEEISVFDAKAIIE